MTAVPPEAAAVPKERPRSGPPGDDETRGLFRASDAVFAELSGPRHVVETANPAFFRALGREETTGVPLAELAPELAEQGIIGLLDGVYRTGRPYTVQDARVLLGPPGAMNEAYYDLTYEPRRGPGGRVAGVTALGVDTTAVRQARQLAAEQRALLEQIALDAPMGDILRAMTAAIEEFNPGVLVSVLLADADGRRLRHGAAPSLPDFYNRAIDGVATGEGVGSCGTAAHRRETVVVADIATHPYWEEFREPALRAGLAACWSTPITGTDGRLLGTFAMYHREPLMPREADLALAAAFARTAALAVERHRTKQARERAEAKERAARQDLAFVLEASTQIGRDLNFHDSLHRLAELSVPELAPMSAVDVLDGGRLTRIAAFAAGERGGRWPQPSGRSALRPDGETVARVLATGVTEVARRVPPSPGPWRELGVTGYVCVPLSWRGAPFAVLTLLFTGERPLQGRTVALAEELARRTAVIAHNARQYTERVELARDLQAGLLLPEPPAVPGAEVATCYRPAGEGLDVGGDFYDVFPLGGGRWAFMIGDVCGRGASAATVTGLVRHTARAVARLVEDPARAVAEVNTALLEGVRHGSAFVTLVYGRMTPGKDGLEVELVRAGHVPPLVRRGGRRVEEVAAGGMLLGVVPDPAVRTARLTLRPEETLFLVTDGFTEARSADGRFLGEEGLAAALARAGREDGAGARELLDEVVASVDRFSDAAAPSGDDSAALVVTAR
ncbi:SpoIIE family protein phosphatase [Streptomyces chitinivorans]|uniref:SpoIIE family protein phosphatase n=1 Tax=Streptomyces chitinivorans TaxID=1257027 RepID=A0ABW7HWG2_9ACTN|nr:SpoIIE family protein phosphatase [Streptomyces chitinivorans]MDH2412323.1 SpoIIE family protein phosphatase [Streptomyces chitinivorans]